jgi:hypothetical protein
MVITVESSSLQGEKLFQPLRISLSQFVVFNPDPITVETPHNLPTQFNVRDLVFTHRYD